MRVGSLSALHRYPVKSMMGEPLIEASLTPTGIAGDRAWAVRDELRGGIRGAKHFAALMQCRARYLDTPPPPGGSAPAEIELPNGEVFATGSSAAAERLSRFLDSPVSLWPLLPRETLDHYRRGAPLQSDMLAELRRIFARTGDEPLPDLSALPAELRTYESPPGTYFDAFPLLLVTTQSLATLAGTAPGSAFDSRRFRPNLLIDAPSAQPFPERAWCGRRVRVGAALLEIKMECPRCVMTTLPFADLPRDPEIMRTLVREAGGNLGVYAVPIEAGAARIGDDVELAS